MGEMRQMDVERSCGLSEHVISSRRGFLLASLGVVLTGCSQVTRTSRLGHTLPSPAWDARPRPPVPTDSGAAEPFESSPGVARPPRFAGVRPRSEWAGGEPVPARMNAMRPIRYVTVHHDGMSPFYGNTEQDGKKRLELIRRAHRGKPEPWGDIGYHFAVDRAGNVWECRPLNYQGAHVKYHNEGNIGVLALGNFDRQQPTEAQLSALRRHVAVLMKTFDVSSSRLRTHQEWAATACPGRNLQTYVDAARRGGVFV
jgi:hypothetical protein